MILAIAVRQAAQNEAKHNKKTAATKNEDGMSSIKTHFKVVIQDDLSKNNEREEEDDVQLAIQQSLGSERQHENSEYVMDSDEEDAAIQIAIQQSFGDERQNAEGEGDGVYDEPGFGAQTAEPFADDEMREATQEEIELATQLDAAQNAQYALQDQDELIEQVPQHPHFLYSFHQRCWGKPNRHQYRTMRHL